MGSCKLNSEIKCAAESTSRCFKHVPNRTKSQNATSTETFESMPEKSVLSRFLLNLSVQQLRATPAGCLPSVPSLMFFSAVWGNYGYSGTVRLFRHICRTIDKLGDCNILECGSGASTVLMGIFAERYNFNVYSLEHDGAWSAHIKSILSAMNLTRSHVMHSPLRPYEPGSYHWYDFPGDLHEKTFSMVVCDGPPSNTPGRRFGLLPVAGPSLATDCVIILDDTHRKGERKTITRWSQLRNFNARSHIALKSFTELCLVPDL